MIIRQLHYSGAPKMFTWVANSLAEKGYDVTVFTYEEDKENRLSDKVNHIHHDLKNCGIIKKVSFIRALIKQISPTGKTLMGYIIIMDLTKGFSTTT